MSDSTRAGNSLDEPSFGLAVASLNTWAIPFASHAVLSRPRLLASDAIARVGHPTSTRQVVLCFQEAWAYKCGLALPVLLLARALEIHCPSLFTTAPTVIFNPRSLLRSVRRVNSWTTLAALLCAWLSALLLPMRSLRYDRTKSDIAAEGLRMGLPFAVGMNGEAGLMAGCNKLLDSGLMMLSSEPPVASGFEAFDPPLSEESRANKGMLWAIYPALDRTQHSPPSPQCAREHLVVTTHMHATSQVIRGAQRAQLARLVRRLRQRYRPAIVIVCGDMNESSVPLAEQKHDFNGKTLFASTQGSDACELSALHDDMAAIGLQKLSDDAAGGTCVKDDGSGETDELDHIYAMANSDEGLRLSPSFRALPPVRLSTSDHFLIHVDGICAYNQ